MIASRRRGHRVVVAVAAVLIGLVLSFGLALRPDVPPVSGAEDRLRAAVGLASAGYSCEAPGCFAVEAGGYAFEVGFSEDSGAGTVRLRALRPILKPDLLVYWTPEELSTDVPAQGSVLLGGLVGTSRMEATLPESASGRGYLTVYSLPHQRIVASFPVRGARGRG